MEEDIKFSRALIALMRGIVFKNRQLELWETIIAERVRLSDYVQKLGLRLIIDELDHYACLKQVDIADIPRLVPRHQLSYPVSLLLVVLRRSMGEYDAANGDSRLILSREEIVEKLRGFFQRQSNEIKFVSDVERYIQKVVELGFLRPLRDQAGVYEIEPVLRGFVTASWLNEFAGRLIEYAAGYTEEADGGRADAEEGSNGFI